MRTDPFAATLKAAAGVARERDLPAFASPTFTTWFRRRRTASSGPEIVLWADTFSNYFQPSVARAAVEALEAAGFAVRVPNGALCCGRPLYDYGMLSRARKYLRRVLDALREDLRRGLRVVVLEPSCLAVFKDELPNLFPDDPDAERLRAQSTLLADVLLDAGWETPALAGRALVHAHCHQKAILGTEPDERLLSGLGLELDVVEAGCCGLAGSFGYEAGERYDVSMKAGERTLLPAVRRATPETLIVTGGFSCRCQIAQATDRHALHPAQVVQLALRASGSVPAPDPPPRPARRAAAAALVVGSALAARALGRSR
jgi:Fe-S oxidoreductase